MSAETASRVAAYLSRRPRAMTLEMARELDVHEADVVRHLPQGRSTELDVGRFDEMMERCAELAHVHVIVSNASATMESTGRLGGFSRSAGYFNIQSATIDMHIRVDRIASAFAVRKPSHMDGVPTLSVQFFDEPGDSSFKVFFTFGQKAATEETRRVWESICTHAV